MVRLNGAVLPVFEPGSVIVVEERWRGRLWSAEPHRVISSDPARLLTEVPAGTVGCYASNRGLPEAEGLTRDQRKHLALKTLVARPLLVPDRLDKIFVFEPDRWSRVNLAWDHDQELLCWYVNFDLPVRPTDDGLWGKDLVLDLLVHPDGSWTVKDADDFERAVAEGILAPGLRPVLEAETRRVLADHEHRRGAFAPELTRLRPRPGEPPVLPAGYLPGGERWRRRYPDPPIPPIAETLSDPRDR